VSGLFENLLMDDFGGVCGEVEGIGLMSNVNEVGFVCVCI